MSDDAKGNGTRPPPRQAGLSGAAARSVKLVAVCLLLYMGLVVAFFVYDHLL